MAYMSQERKKELSPAIKAVFKKYGIKGSISVQHYSKLVVKIKSGSIDFMRGYADIHNMKAERGQRDYTMIEVPEYVGVNEFHIDSNFDGVAEECLTELLSAMNGVGTDDENFDKSDAMTDYFQVGWYTDITIGTWEKPYTLTK